MLDIADSPAALALISGTICSAVRAEYDSSARLCEDTHSITASLTFPGKSSPVLLRINPARGVAVLDIDYREIEKIRSASDRDTFLTRFDQTMRDHGLSTLCSRYYGEPLPDSYR